MATGIHVAVPVFVSYSHADLAALERLRVHLKPLFRQGLIRYWDDRGLKPGQHWRQQILQSIDAARVFVLLLSQDFLASDFIDAEELPRILAAQEQVGATVLVVYLKPLRDGAGHLAALQAVNNPARPMSALSEHEQEAVWVQLQEAVAAALRVEQPAAASPAPQAAQATSSQRPPPLRSMPALRIGELATPHALRKRAITPQPRPGPMDWLKLGQPPQAGQAGPKPTTDEPRYPPGIDSIISLGFAPYDALQRDWALDDDWRHQSHLRAEVRGDGLLHVAELDAHVQMRLRIGYPGMSPSMAPFEIRESRNMLAAMARRQLQAVAYMTPRFLALPVNLRQRLSQTWMNDEHEKSTLNQTVLDRARMRWHAWGREHPDFPNGLANALRELDEIAAAAGLR